MQGPRLNLGCGQTRPAGWINCDSSLNSLLQSSRLTRPIARGLLRTTRYTASARYMDLRRRWPFRSDSIAVVYASHVLEHLPWSGAQHFLGEAQRVLQPLGVIRIVVPDLYQAAKQYVERYERGDPASAEGFLTTINLHQEGAYAPGRNFAIRWLNWLQGHPHQHKYMYDALTLPGLLVRHGFAQVAASSYGMSALIPEIRDVEATREGVPSIYFEARKEAH